MKDSSTKNLVEGLKLEEQRLREQLQRIVLAIEALEEAPSSKFKQEGRRRRRSKRRMSQVARQKIAAAQRARWARQKALNAGS